MYLAKVLDARRLLLVMAATVLVVVIASCGSGSSESTTTSTAEGETAADTASADEDHDDEGHDDEDHDDEDHDDDHDDESAAGGLDAHVHGSAELFVAWSDSDVIVDLISPANNIFGFEYEPSTDEDIEIVADRTAALTAPDLLTFTNQAGCALAGDPESEFEVDGSHAEVTTSWLFVCEELGELRELDLTALFAEFPRLEDVDAQWASPDNQSAAELSPSAPILQFS